MFYVGGGYVVCMCWLGVVYVLCMFYVYIGYVVCICWLCSGYVLCRFYVGLCMLFLCVG